MSHTPEQARELWCPMVRVVQIGATETTSTYNRVLAKHHVPVNLADPDDGGKAMQAAILKTEVQMSQASCCIADKCAMWRWLERRSQVHRVKAMCEDRFAETEPARPAGLNNTFVFVPCDEDTDAHWAEPEEVWFGRRLGYCGLAGRPEVAP